MKLKQMMLALVTAALAGCATYGHTYKVAPPDAMAQKIASNKADYEAKSQAGDAGAMYELARLYANGWGVQADPVRAYGYLLKSATAGDQKSQALLAIAFYNGWGEYGVGQDFKQALHWSDKVLAVPPVNTIKTTNYPRVALYSQIIWQDGLVGPSDWGKAKKAGAIALKYADPDGKILPLALHNQGVMYILEDGASDAQREEGYELLKKAARADEPQSQAFLRKRAVKWD